MVFELIQFVNACGYVLKVDFNNDCHSFPLKGQKNLVSFWEEFVPK